MPEAQGVVFYPARLGVNLREFLLRRADDVAVVVENNGPGAGCALVQREQINRLCHGVAVGISVGMSVGVSEDMSEDKSLGGATTQRTA